MCQVEDLKRTSCLHLHSIMSLVSGEHGFVVVADVLEPEQVRKSWGKRLSGWVAWEVFLFFRTQNSEELTWKLAKNTLFLKKKYLPKSLFLGFYLGFFGGGYVIEASSRRFPVIGNWKDAMKLDAMNHGENGPWGLETTFSVYIRCHRCRDFISPKVVFLDVIYLRVRYRTWCY